MIVKISPIFLQKSLVNVDWGNTENKLFLSIIKRQNWVHETSEEGIHFIAIHSKLRIQYDAL